MNNYLMNSQNVKFGGITSEFYKHITDDSIHVTAEQKDKINEIIKDYEYDIQDIESQIQSLKLDIASRAKIDSIPTNISQLNNDSNFIQSIPDYYTTEEEVKLLINDAISNIDIGDLSSLEEQISNITKLVNQNVIQIEDLQQLSHNNYDNIQDLQKDIESLYSNINSIQSNIVSIESRISDLEDSQSGGDTGGGSDYKLPIASSSTLGGVKIGTGINVDDDGTISASFDIGDIDTDTVIDVIQDWVKTNYITKSDDDSTPHKLWVGYNDKSETSVQNQNGVIAHSIKNSTFISNQLTGTGFYLGDTAPGQNSEFGSGSVLEVDNVSVRKKISFNTLEIKRISQVGGTLVMSAAGATLSDVEYIGNYQSVADCYKCYLKTEDGDNYTSNDFVAGDLIRCQTFNVLSASQTYQNKYYNAQVVDTGKDDGDYIIIGNFDSSHYGIPAKGDVVVQMGYAGEDDESRANLIVLSAVDNNSPSIIAYSHVHDYDFKNAQLQAIISPDQVQFRSNLFKLLSGDGSHSVAIDRGQWSSNETYYYWDRVSYNGSLWLCVYNDTLGCTNIVPGSEGSGSYWLLQVSKGEDGQNGQNGQDGDVSGVYQMQLSDQTLFTYYNEADQTYSPNLKGTTINISVYKGNKLLLPSEYTITTQVSDESVTVGLPVQSTSTTNISIGKVNVQPNNSAKIIIKATITAEESDITLTSSVTILCLDVPVANDSYNCLVSGQGLYQTFDVNTNSSGKITLIYLPEPIKANVTAYLGDNIITDVNTITDGDELSAQLQTNSQKVNIYAEYSTDQDTNQIRSFDCETVTEGASATFALQDLGFTNTQIDSPLVDPSKSLNYPCTTGSITIKIWYPGNTSVSSPNYTHVLDVDLKLSSNVQWFKVTSGEFQSVQGQITDLGAQYTTISQTVSGINLSLTTVENTVGTLGTKLDELDNTVNSWVGITKNDLKLAGLYVNYDQGEQTGSIDIIADKFQLYNQEYSTTSGSSGQKYMWYNQDSHILNMSEVDIVGGTIGGFKISETSITAGDATSPTLSNGKMSLTSQRITFESNPGGNKVSTYAAVNNNLPYGNGTPAMVVDTQIPEDLNTYSISPHYYSKFSGGGLDDELVGKNVGLSFYAEQGQIVGTNVVVGVGYSNQYIASTQEGMIRLWGGTTILSYNTSADYKAILLPTYSSVIEDLHLNTTAQNQTFAIPITIINFADGYPLEIKGNGLTTNDDSGYPIIINPYTSEWNSDHTPSTSVQIKWGESIQFMLVYQASSRYIAYVTSWAHYK